MRILYNTRNTFKYHFKKINSQYNLSNVLFVHLKDSERLL